MDTWLNFFRDASESQLLESPKVLSLMFTLDLKAPHVSAIQANLSQASLGEINRAVENSNILNGDWSGLISLCKAYLHWCALIDPNNPQDCFESYAKVFLAVQQAFNNVRGSALNSVVKQVVGTIERLFSNHGKLYVEWIAAGILKLLNSVRSEREIPSFGVSKKDNVLFYANMISRVYFKSQQFVSAGNVFKNMYSLEVKFSQFPYGEQVEFRYWLGRYFLYVNHLELAYTHLYWACSKCLPTVPQYSLILDWLILPSILVGRMPKPELVSMLRPDAKVAIEPIMEAIKTGVFSENYRATVQTNQWIQSHHLRPLIEQYVPLLVYRKGLHRLINISGADKLPLQICRTAFHLSSDEDPNYNMTEGILIGLISNGLVKGNILPRNKVLTLKATGSVPPLVDHYDLRLTDRDSWLRA